MTDCRPLYRPGREPPEISNGAPQGQSKQAQDARRELGEFLDSALARPLYFDNLKRQEQIESALNTMTPAERVFAEIDMLERRHSMFTSDYDPLR